MVYVPWFGEFIRAESIGCTGYLLHSVGNQRMDAVWIYLKLILFI